ncbi:MAG: capsule assembly Wzi family protein [Ignavibacteriales bacterium]|nr:MAG: hypothetical protein F9K26_12830 [Ignavibacteriaceae bacterium]MBW7874321.1 hypothetical protein [Ignavibacteria bacterium]MCZ2142505.1 capsule assembly Wzi family protein [Ignavibacteriales bacterium]OQY76127.1 MAG: hypothetical protein B6D45_04480 [Ignavibacteriales bacterium UTCHB3]MBV6445386.1 hypothetical protein [Ignavibacteriaceae bacterium]
MLRRAVLVLVLFAGISYAQVVFTRVDDPVYDLLSRCDAVGLVRFNSEVKPLPRMEVARLLLEIYSHKGELSPVEAEELSYFLEEFGLEVSRLTKSGKFSGQFGAGSFSEDTGSGLEKFGSGFGLSGHSEKSDKISEGAGGGLEKFGNGFGSGVFEEFGSGFGSGVFEEFGSGSGFAGLGGQIPAYRDELPAPPGFTPPLPAYQAPTPLPKERWWLFDYTDDQFAFRLSPVFGYGVRLVSGETNNIRWPGAKVFGYGGDWFGASFEYVDFGETGSNTDKSKKFTPVTGAFVNNQTGSTFEYSDVKGSVSFNWSWGYISVIKDYQTWGSGQFSQLILSTKAPSFTQVRFHVNPVSWFRFNYYQGWVNSLIYDSTAFFWSHPESISPSEITPYKDKYVVSNLATFTPVGWLDVSLGNAFVYGPHFRFETLIPFLYYKVMDHNTGRIRGDDGNGMIFFDFKVRSPRNFAFYGTAYIDVINLRDLLNGRFDNQWVAFTLGAKRYNLFLPMLDVSLEYTRINPWNYENRNDLTSYKHLGYQLGHWIGQNADQLRLQVNYSHFRGLRHFAYVEWVRKGIEADIAIAYNAKKFGTVPFLQSPLRSDFRFGFETAWEPFHELKLRGYYEFSSISDEDPLRTPKYLRGDNHSLGLILSYGI